MLVYNLISEISTSPYLIPKYDSWIGSLECADGNNFNNACKYQFAKLHMKLFTKLMHQLDTTIQRDFLQPHPCRLFDLTPLQYYP